MKIKIEIKLGAAGDIDRDGPDGCNESSRGSKERLEAMATPEIHFEAYGIECASVHGFAAVGAIRLLISHDLAEKISVLAKEFERNDVQSILERGKRLVVKVSGIAETEDA